MFCQCGQSKKNSMNTAAYIIYLFITYIITVHVGLVFYRNGRIFILRLLDNDEKLTDAINNTLLAGYYLLNLGYAAIMIRLWKSLHTWTEVFTSIGSMTGKIMLTLAIMHFANIAFILFLSYRKHRLVNNKT